jgi:septal ring factor EnvC (AmiA/AmiB activator)
MAAVTNELIYEVLKQVQSDIAEPKQGQREINARLNALTAHMVGLQQDISNIYATLTRQDARLERIERRLELSETPA